MLVGETMHFKPCYNPDINILGAIMGPIWGRQVPGGPHVGPMNFATWEVILIKGLYQQLFAASANIHPIGAMSDLICPMIFLCGMSASNYYWGSYQSTLSLIMSI